MISPLWGDLFLTLLDNRNHKKIPQILISAINQTLKTFYMIFFFFLKISFLKIPVIVL